MMMEMYQDLLQVLMIAGLLMSVTSAHAGVFFVRNGSRQSFGLMQQKVLTCSAKAQTQRISQAKTDTWQTRLVYIIQRKIAPDDDDDAHHRSFFLSYFMMKKGADRNENVQQWIHPTTL